ncbi:MAG: hypothetical protein M3032_09095 [Verrucomicrobiota bacterium]|nr:hypothetical protein [Verrucomicrobiota bacterium]
MLRELFAALGNDPTVIAECLARPLVAERVLRSLYPYDERIHGELKKRAESDLRAYPGLNEVKLTSGTYSEIVLVRREERGEQSQRPVDQAIELNSSEWDETVQKLATAFDNRAAFTNAPVPVGYLTPLQEDETRYYATAVTEKADGYLKLATLTWSKEPIESWRGRAKAQLTGEMAALIAVYTLPPISGEASGCTADSWAATSLNLPEARSLPTGIWTGSEVIFWGGSVGYPSTPKNTGGRYNPSTDAWTTMSTIAAPSARGGHTAVWTGREMIVWGGGWLNTGGRYDPATDTWIPTSAANAPTGRSGHSGVWTGSEMIVWGGRDNSGPFNTGGRYNPNTNSWTPTSNVNAPAARNYHSTVWTGSEMIVWGGDLGTNQYLTTGGRYNPITDSWAPTSTTGAPTARALHTAVWTGSKMIVWGGQNIQASPYQGYDTGGQYDPGTNAWTGTSTINAPAGRYYHTAVWTGSEMVIWGGTGGGITNTGGKYNPGTDTWIPSSTSNAPRARWIHAAVWTGNEMVIWGGENGKPLNTGGRYNPNTDTWAGTQLPTAQDSHNAVWTGSEMIVRGGFDGYSPLNTGGKYSPATDSWTTTSIVSAPGPRYYQTAVWTGAEMIVWGGFDGNCSVNSGGRYDPSADSLSVTSTAGAPAGRSYHSSVWTGSELIVWGGHDCAGHTFSSGGKYNPTTNAWSTTSSTNAPAARSRQTAVWTGNEMIVWGGTPTSQGFESVNTGGRYHPNTDTWNTTSAITAPAARSFHSAIWTGSEMIVWGGRQGTAFMSPFLASGGRYNPSTDSWTTTTSTNAPSARGGHAAVWTGRDMIVWGGGIEAYPGVANDGYSYEPGSDTWKAINTAHNAPDALGYATAMWTGSEIIFWSGRSGARYCADLGPTAPPTPTPTPTPTATPTPTVTPSPTPTPSIPPLPVATMSSLSTRGTVGTGDNVMIAGFKISGSAGQMKRVLIRGIGPSLRSYNVPDTLSDPLLELHQKGGAVVINDNWADALNANEIPGDLRPTDPRESAIVATVEAGAHTVILRGAGATSGNALVQVYDLATGAAIPIANLSTRGVAGTGDNVMVAGLIVEGAPGSTRRVVLRGIGPSLAQYGVPNILADPVLTLHKADGSTVTNDDWARSPNVDQIPVDLRPQFLSESVIVATLPPGPCTVVLSGSGGTSGNALVEIYGFD